jgi:hypothetical protein
VSARAFGFTLRYRPVGPDLVGPEGPDQRPVDRLPSVSGPTVGSFDARESALLVECRQLEAQGYQIERVERWNECRRCQGSGKVAVRPKGWRKKEAPPWYAMRRVECPACGGEGAEHIVESVQDLPGGAR